MSSAPESQQTGYGNTPDGPITEAQQKAQHYGRYPVENAPYLAIVIDAWHTLPPDTRAAILAIVEATHRR